MAQLFFFCGWGGVGVFIIIIFLIIVWSDIEVEEN